MKILVAGGGIAFLILGISAAPQLKFEVAAIKPCDSGDAIASGGRGGGGARSLSSTPGRLTIGCMTVAELINVAYVQFGADPLINDSTAPLDPKRIRGGPAWAYSTRYTIEAKAESTAGSANSGPMLQSLLEERFQLKMHREVEDVPAYSLTVAKGGLNLKVSDEGCTPFVIGMTYADPSLAPDGKPWCRNRTRRDGGTWIVESAGQTIGGLIKMLPALDRIVIDRTGVTGVFSFHVEFAADENAPGRGAEREVERAGDLPAGPTVFTALEQQLGLKLMPDKGPRGFIVIDRMERPSQN